MPRAPAGLGASARRLWRLAWSLPWVAASDGPLVEVACRLVDDLDALRRLSQEDPGDHRARREARMAERNLAQALGLLGMSPADRTRLGQAAPESDAEVLHERRLAQVRQLLGKTGPA